MGKDQTTPRTSCPPLYDECVGSLTSPADRDSEHTGEGTYSLSSLSRRTGISNHLQMSWQGQHIPWVWVRYGAQTWDLPYGSATLYQLWGVHSKRPPWEGFGYFLKPHSLTKLSILWCRASLIYSKTGCSQTIEIDIGNQLISITFN